MTLAQAEGVGMTSLRTRRRLIDRLIAQGISNPLVLDAIESVPRHLFVDASIAHLAYEDMALPIGKRQTISQPYIVGLMTQAILEVPDVTRVLEIGTGCGYQAAVLSRVVGSVFTIERIRSLSDRARQTLRTLKLYNVRLKFGDGMEGWDEHAPYDAIILTAVARTIPETLKAQIRNKGRIVIPRARGAEQDLVLMDLVDGKWKEKVIESVEFVPLLPGTA